MPIPHTTPSGHEVSNPFARLSLTRGQAPTPAYARPPSTTPASPDARYPPFRSTTPTRTPATYHPSTSRTAPSLRSPSTPSTLHRATHTALPVSPPTRVSPYITPPSSFPSRFREAVELSPIHSHRTLTRALSDSPFDDRHSILVEQVETNLDGEEDPFEYHNVDVTRQKTMEGYMFAHRSPMGWNREGKEIMFGAQLDQIRPVSQARRSLYPLALPIPVATIDQHPDLLAASPFEPDSPLRTALRPIKPTFRALFALTSPRESVVTLLPAVLLAIACSLAQPYMSLVLGRTFQVFTSYPLDPSQATGAQRSSMSGAIGQSAIELAAAGALTALGNYVKHALWIRNGESIARRLREAVYLGVQDKPMEWFDLGMGMRLEDDSKADAIGAGGLMAKFSKETDDVRIATSLAMGLAVQNLSTFLLCFILAMMKGPVLALVTLCTIPLVVLVQIVTQVLAGPLDTAERRAFAEVSTNVERATAAIATVKIHNAQQSEVNRYKAGIAIARAKLETQALLWGFSIGATDFLTLGTFVVGFWYGAKEVREGKISPGNVMTVFWAAILAATYLQAVVPQLMIITKGKMSMASLLSIIQVEPGRAASGSPVSPSGSPHSTAFPFRPNSTARHSRQLSLKGIRPPRCRGEFDLRNVSFAYPSRLDVPVLRDVTLFLPPGETTFIVGGSGSGKSTIAQLLLRLYVPTGGEIILDDQSFPYLDEAFTREHIAAIQQGCILFDMSVHDNVAMGLAGAGSDLKTGMTRRPLEVSRGEVVDACKMAMIHEFIESLPEGYETKLGTGGSTLSGGQKQRLAIARARIRDPTILILDEATSALDATSRVLVFEAIKRWRKNMTTIVITHDLSQIVPDDFVYVMRNGVVEEHGFRSDLIKKTALYGQPLGVFAAMAAEQAIEPVPLKAEEWRARAEDDEELLDGEEANEQHEPPDERRPSFAQGMRPGSVMYLGVLDEYARSARFSVQDEEKHVRRQSRPLSLAQKRLSWSPADLDLGRRSRQSLVGSRPVSRMSRNNSLDSSPIIADRQTIPANGIYLPTHSAEQDRHLSTVRYQQRSLSENLDDDLKGSTLSVIVPIDSDLAATPSQPKMMGIVRLIFHFFPHLPAKHMLFFGVAGAVAHGVTTPIWASYLSKLMTIVGSGGTSPLLVTYGLIVLALCLAQALADFAQEYFLYALAARWTARIRETAFVNVLAQDKAWFDDSANSPARLVQSLIKDADDMRQLMLVIGKFTVVVVMIGLGIVWSLTISWRLTLIGVALGPVFAVIMVLNEAVVATAEVANKAKREAVARTFHESVSNVRGIRAMALDGAFKDKFEKDAVDANRQGKKAAWVAAIGSGAVSGIPLLAQALMLWVGAVFIVKNDMNYAQMLQVYNLILFSLTFATQMLDFIPSISKVKAASRDFNRLFTLTSQTEEAKGDLRFPITGNVTFDRVSFSYPTRPDLPILADLSFTLTPGECVAIVGPSGSAKSTIAALLQRLYEPTSGSIRMGKHSLVTAETKWLRNHIAVVSQSANLFDATVADNIAYGSNVPIGEVHRAAKAANIHEFITSLPEGYETNLGENASLISGGQAQRLQIARALVRRSNILILDECTSALDIDNQRAVLDTIVKIKDTRTTVFITHSVEAMRRCDRVICLGDGKVAEDGSFESLTAKGGVFAQLMRTGEWE